MQARPGPYADHPHPPAKPQIPLAAINSLIPRLTSTINDIDNFKNLLAQGAQDGSMPNWELLLQRYAILLSRINALSTYLAQPAPAPPILPGVPRPPPDNRPALEKFIVHPLNPLPPSIASDSIAPEAFFQVINTQMLPSASEAQAALLNGNGPSRTAKADLQRMSEIDLTAVTRRLRERLEKEGKVADGVREMLQKHSEEYDWGMRVGGEGAEEAIEEGGRPGEGAQAGVEDEEDLFGDDDDSTAPVPAVSIEGGGALAVVPTNPREGWTISEYMRYMDTGITPHATA